MPSAQLAVSRPVSQWWRRWYRRLISCRTSYRTARLLALVGICALFSVTSSAEMTPDTGSAAPSGNAVNVEQYGYSVISRLRFDRNNFTQGLEIHDGLRLRLCRVILRLHDGVGRRRYYCEYEHEYDAAQ